MEKDFLKELEYLGITARLKRMSDSLSYNIKELYKMKDIDIEPSWHLVFLILKKHKTITMTEIADAFHISQPGITKMITKMKKKGYINIRTNGNDNRKKQVELSQKGLKELPKFEKIWNAGQQSIKDMLEANKEFLISLEKFEKQIKYKNFKDRTINHLKK